MPRVATIKPRADTGLGRKLMAEIKEAKARAKHRPGRNGKKPMVDASLPPSAPAQT